MEIKVGIQNVNREVVLEVKEAPADIEQAVLSAIKDETLLSLTDEHGRRVLIPAKSIGYVDIGEENGRRVGFGAV
ncbi:hypothetical protein FHX74_003288 [Friedmanniella endophytica]|uniref:DUF3107 domain-containing protein n=1 Tax=Microlunatus kandeliicorticis TaxID=1759536 RepID=A0A7W3IUV1_9ACTN|nr:DUF3107 domain-containing protein [Microlunatus kandeliicorticis]MBA8795652.1 hypothetical protein [Microlunatus kandeliicorticis]